MTVTGIDAAKARKYVLSIDGGGFRGYTCLVVLHHLMRQLAENPADGIPLPCQVFDVISGTSTGGLIAVLLGRLGLDCLTAMSVYRELVTALFTDVDQKVMDSIVDGERISRDAFEEKLATIVEKYTGDKDASMRIHKTRTDKLNHLNTDTFVTVVHSTAGAAGVEPYRVRSYTAPRGVVESVLDHDWTVCEVIRAATALPGYFKPVDIGSQSFQDAVLSGSANPVREAIAEVELRGSQNFEPLIISLGTGLVSLSSSDVEDELSDHSGSQQPGRIFRTNAFSKQLLDVARDTELAHREAKKYFRNMNLARNYFRFDPSGGLGDLRASDITQVPRITALTNAWLQTPEGYGETSRAYRVLKERFDETRTRDELQHSEADSNPDSDTEPSGVLEVRSQGISVTQSDVSSHGQVNEPQHPEEDSDSDSDPRSSGAPEAPQDSVVRGDISSPSQQSDAHPTERPPPTANEGFNAVHKDSWINALRKSFSSQKNNRPTKTTEAGKNKATPNVLKRTLSNLITFKRKPDADTTQKAGRPPE
ncbi:FabD/lysophospholipase-like protein [Imleria badia]|nr:FabD/lysophospholipase-like protein [Imleria badia]